jgi:hypothetical protein
VVDVRTADGRLGNEGLAAVVSRLGDEVSASALPRSVAADAREIRDDMAACVLAPTPPGGGDAQSSRRERPSELVRART